MKLLSAHRAPNPRRVLMFIVEKGITGIEVVHGTAGTVACSTLPEADFVVSAIVGVVGPRREPFDRAAGPLRGLRQFVESLQSRPAMRPLSEASRTAATARREPRPKASVNQQETSRQKRACTFPGLHLSWLAL